MIAAMTVVVQRFGRLHDDPIRACQRQASETRQGTKSREVIYGARRELLMGRRG
jgi:hypothetical protein